MTVRGGAGAIVTHEDSPANSGLKSDRIINVRAWSFLRPDLKGATYNVLMHHLAQGCWQLAGGHGQDVFNGVQVRPR